MPALPLRAAPPGFRGLLSLSAGATSAKLASWENGVSKLHELKAGRSSDKNVGAGVCVRACVVMVVVSLVQAKLGCSSSVAVLLQ